MALPGAMPPSKVYGSPAHHAVSESVPSLNSRKKCLLDSKTLEGMMFAWQFEVLRYRRRWLVGPHASTSFFVAEVQLARRGRRKPAGAGRNCRCSSFGAVCRWGQAEILSKSLCRWSRACTSVPWRSRCHPFEAASRLRRATLRQQPATLEAAALSSIKGRPLRVSQTQKKPTAIVGRRELEGLGKSQQDSPSTHCWCGGKWVPGWDKA